MKKLILTILTIMPLILSAQSLSDIYNYSSTRYQGTAKSIAMGNAIGAVGQDLSAIEINPAGLIALLLAGKGFEFFEFVLAEHDCLDNMKCLAAKRAG